VESLCANSGVCSGSREVLHKSTNMVAIPIQMSCNANMIHDVAYIMRRQEGMPGGGVLSASSGVCGGSGNLFFSGRPN
jgi:hypothetical protein